MYHVPSLRCAVCAAEGEAERAEAAVSQEDEEEDEEVDPIAQRKKQAQLARHGIDFTAKADPKVSSGQDS